VASVQRVSAIIGEIALASSEQTTGVEQVNQAIIEMDHVTQQNAALVEQAAAAAKAMQDQAASLAQAVSVFKIDAGAARQHAPGRALALR
jgi:methyl-accepting chemotaxis protein